MLDRSRVVRALGIGLPGPVDHINGPVTTPSRMPGWHQSEVATTLSERLSVPVVVDNDANLMAVGEYVSRGSTVQRLVAVKLGTGIGCGVITGGQVHHGASGVAGDIGHVRVPDAEPLRYAAATPAASRCSRAERALLWRCVEKAAM